MVNNRIEKRRKYIKQALEGVDKKFRYKVIQELSNRLFLSERTIYNDLKED